MFFYFDKNIGNEQLYNMELTCNTSKRGYGTLVI